MVNDFLRMYHSSSWHSEPYHQIQNHSDKHYRTIKAWTNTSLNRCGAPADCWLFCMSYVCYLLNHVSCESLKGQIPITNLYGVTPDISIFMMYSFYQSEYYASHTQSSLQLVKKCRNTPINCKTEHGQTFNGQVTYLGFLRLRTHTPMNYSLWEAFFDGGRCRQLRAYNFSSYRYEFAVY